MFQLSFLKKENDLNKVLRKIKRDRSRISILFVSLWDKYSEQLVDQVSAKYASSERGEKLYIVDSFHMPHSFVIFKTSKVPHLVQLRYDNTVSEDYLPMIRKVLRLTSDPV